MWKKVDRLRSLVVRVPGYRTEMYYVRYELHLYMLCRRNTPPLWWSEFLATDSEVRVPFPVLPNFLRCSGSGTGFTNFMSTIEELLERKSSGSGLESREYDSRNPSRWPRGILCPHKLAITSPTRGGRSVGIFRSRTETTEFVLFEYSDAQELEYSCWLQATLARVRRSSPGSVNKFLFSTASRQALGPPSLLPNGYMGL
jgi:hypothetical protein